MRRVETQPKLVAQVYSAVLDEICSGELKPRMRLKQEALAMQFDVSRQPIQKALLLLEEDGLVEKAVGRGMIVSTIDAQNVADRYCVRRVLDELAVRLAVKRCQADPSVGHGLASQYDGMAAAALTAAEAGDFGRMFTLDIQFHEMIYNASGNPALIESAEVHWHYLKRAMISAMREGLADAPAIWTTEHRAIIDAIARGDAEAAARAAADHIQSNASAIDAHFAERSERAA